MRKRFLTLKQPVEELQGAFESEVDRIDLTTIDQKGQQEPIQFVFFPNYATITRDDDQNIVSVNGLSSLFNDENKLGDPYIVPEQTVVYLGETYANICSFKLDSPIFNR